MDILNFKIPPWQVEKLWYTFNEKRGYSMNIYDFIVQANQEFTLNGRSKRFVGMEDRILRSGKILPIYFFARYTKGVDVKKFEKYMLNNATLDECYYFGTYVPGAKMMPFVTRAINEGNKVLLEYMVRQGSYIAFFIREQLW